MKNHRPYGDPDSTWRFQRPLPRSEKEQAEREMITRDGKVLVLS